MGIGPDLIIPVSPMTTVRSPDASTSTADAKVAFGFTGGMGYNFKSRRGDANVGKVYFNRIDILLGFSLRTKTR